MDSGHTIQALNLKANSNIFQLFHSTESAIFECPKLGTFGQFQAKVAMFVFKNGIFSGNFQFWCFFGHLYRMMFMLVRISMLVILLLWTYLWRGWTWLWSVGYILLIMLLMIVQHLRLGGLRVVLGGYCDCHRVPGGGSSKLGWNSSFCRKTQPLSGLLNTIHLENQAHCFHTFIFLSKFGIFQVKNGQFFFYWNACLF